MGLPEDMYECWRDPEKRRTNAERCALGPRSNADGYTEDELDRLWHVPRPKNAPPSYLALAFAMHEIMDIVACPTHHARAQVEWGEG